MLSHIKDLPSESFILGEAIEFFEQLLYDFSQFVKRRRFELQRRRTGREPLYRSVSLLGRASAGGETRPRPEREARVHLRHASEPLCRGAVALHFPELAARQMAEAVKEYDFRGFMITPSVAGEEISAPRFDPFWRKAEELDTVIFVHPRGFSEGNERFGGHGWLGNTIGNPLETTVALSHMIFDGFLDRFERLKICAAHGGGYLPSYIGRSDNCYAVDPRCQHMTKKPSEYLKQLYFDTLVYSPEILRRLVDQVGADRVVIGTDYPFPVASRDPLGDVLSVPGLGDDEKEAIPGATAARLLKIRRRK